LASLLLGHENILLLVLKVKILVWVMIS